MSILKGLRGIFGLVILLIVSSFSGADYPKGETVEWISWEEAVRKVNEPGNTKKVFVDVYTDWCGWCKVMDKKTFNHPEVAKYMSENFYMVKFDAEQKEDVEYKGTTFKYVPSGRKGYHELAAALLHGELSYPSVLFLDEDMNLITKVPGFHPPEDFYPIARYFGDDKYLNEEWEEFRESFKAPF
ncbi:MAG: DUF255 domain-containing protein [bacterium]|jgi:thioredoxin-related protein|nr:DUF255 domain-containing protein [bacterium]